ncbi:cytochrome P450 [Aspergillus keveii]|uniref:Cytochrome P450 n=1 Tax=Aspergillus keveii TaxID=714993 RepID=A0ABR4GIX1_9EURO
MIWDYIFGFASFPNLSALLVLSLAGWLLFNKYGRGLSHIKGPAVAGYTDLWRLWIVWQRRPEVALIALHKKYGRVVRIGPSAVSVSNPAAIKVIYGVKGRFVKSDFYPVQQTLANGRPLHSLFNTTDEKYHGKLRRGVANAYAMSTLVQFEPLVDSTIKAFLQQMDERYADKQGPEGVCDFGAWLQFFAFDVIDELTFSKRLGFVDEGRDVDGIIGDLEWLLDYVSVVGQLPIIDRFLLKNPLRLLLNRFGMLNSTSPVVAFARKRMGERQAKQPQTKPATPPPRRDFLSRFLEAHERDPDFFHHQRVLALTVANMFAGSDTTAITLRAIFYFLLRNPESMVKLVAELDGMEEDAHDQSHTQDPNPNYDPDPLVKWDNVRDLPYLTAVIKEALRCHPAAGLPLERVAPAGGITIGAVERDRDGDRDVRHWIPGGTIIGCSAWTVHLDEGVFGACPEQFRPERWIEASTEQQREMSSCLFSFGSGTRSCIGKNISLLEMYKLVPAVLGKYEIVLADKRADWKIHNAWFVKQSGFKVRLRTRRQK